jgi:hypothetical protein
MWTDSVGFFFLVRLFVVPAVRFLFSVVGEVRCLAVGLLLGVALFASLRLLSVLLLCSLVAAVLGLLVALLVPLRPLRVPHTVVGVLRT